MGAKRSRIGRKIRIAQFRRHFPARILPFLMHANGAEHAIVDDQINWLQIILQGRCQFIAGHQKPAVTDETDSRAFWIDQGCRQGRGHAIAHGTIGRPNLAGVG